MSRLSLSLLGPFGATLDGRPVIGFRSNKVRALLAYLAAEAGRPHSRETLAGLLWPNYPDAVALGHLRNALSSLRQNLGDRPGPDPIGLATTNQPSLLLVERDAVQLDPVGAWSADALEFERGLARYEAPTGEASGATYGAREEMDNLRAAVALYRGSFLEGFAPVGSPAFDDWLVLRRERHDRQIRAALGRLATLHEQSGEWEAAVAYARRRLELEPWDEVAHRQVMRLLALSGERSVALAAYHECRRRLAEELGVEPARDTVALYEAIRDEVMGQVLVAPSPVAGAQPESRRRRFVGRERELAALDRRLAAALGGKGGVVFLVGEAGSGKTMLAAEFAGRSMQARADLVVAGGNCSAQAGLGDPYLAFREVLQLLSGDIEARRVGGPIQPEQARRLWEVMPAVVQALADVGPSLIGSFVPAAGLTLRAEAFAPTGAAWRRRLIELTRSLPTEAPLAHIAQTDLFDQVTRVLQVVARRRPLLLLLDDLQWADNGSVSLLFHLGRRLAGSRILVVGAYRPEDVALSRDGERHPLGAVIHELERDCGDIQVDLSQADGRRFVDQLLDTEPNELGLDFRAALYRHTEGHPLFTDEALHGLKEWGELTRDEAGRWRVERDVDWERLPRRVEAAIAERVERLPREYQTLLEAAAVEGEVFTAEVVARALGHDPGEVAQALSGPLSKQHRVVVADSLQRLDDQRLSRYHFRHALFQHYIYHRLDEVERARLHEAVGVTLESLYAASEEQVASLAPQLAWRFEQAGLIDKAVHYRRHAGDQAMRLSACAEAITHYTRALDLLAALPASPERATQELALRQAITVPLLITRGWGGRAIQDALTRASALARAAGATGNLVMALANLSNAYLGQGQAQQALDLAEEVLRLAQQDQATRALVVAHAVIGEARFFRGELLAGRDHLERASALSASEAPAALKLHVGIELNVNCLGWLAWVLMALGYPDQADCHSRQAIDRACELADTPTLAFALAVPGALFRAFHRDFEMAQRYAEALRRLATEKGLPFYQAPAMIAEGMAVAGEGQVETGIAQMQQGLAAWQAGGTRAGQVALLALLGVAQARAGQVEPALDVVDEALRVVEQTGLGYFHADLWRLRGAILERRERVDEGAVEVCFQRAITLAREQGARWWELRATTSLARLWQRQGRTDEAHALLAEIYGWFTEGFNTPDVRDARALLEELAYNMPIIVCPSSAAR